MIGRSHLYVPGDAPDKLAKALHRGADALIVDLEDAVAPARKDEARQIVADWLGSLIDPQGGSPGDRQGEATGDLPVEVWVRVNPGALREVDIRAIARQPALTGLCLAKVDDAAEVVEVDRLLSSLASPALVSPLLETAAAVLRAAEIARAPRVRRLQLGEADLRAETGIEPSEDEREMLLVRSTVVLASAAAGIDPPVAPVSTDYRDLNRLRASTLALKRLGYRGRACIHPAQVAVVNEVFTPSVDEVARARDLIDRFDAAMAAGSGVCVDANGRLVDEAVVRASRLILATARPDQDGTRTDDGTRPGNGSRPEDDIR